MSWSGSAAIPGAAATRSGEADTRTGQLDGSGQIWHYGQGVGGRCDERLRGPDDGRVQTVGDRVGRDDLDVGEADCRQAEAVLVERERAGDATHEAAAFGSLCRGQSVVGHDIAHADPATGAEDA